MCQLTRGDVSSGKLDYNSGGTWTPLVLVVVARRNEVASTAHQRLVSAIVQHLLVVASTRSGV